MKKKLKPIILLILVSPIFLIGCISSEKYENNDLEKMNLFGDVKSLTVTFNPDSVKYTTTNYDFNRRGNLRNISKYNTRGLTSNIKYKKYDNKGNLRNKMEYVNDSYMGTSTYSFGDSYKYTNIYNDAGNLVQVDEQIIKYGPIKKINDKKEYKLINIHTYAYDTEGNQIKKQGSNADGTIWHKYTYKYDDHGNQVEEHEWNLADSFKTILRTYIYEFDDYGNAIKKQHQSPNGKLKVESTYKYDDSGNMVEWIIYDYKGSIHSIFTYEYDFDMNKNWIKKTTYDEKSAVINSAEREIEYYN